VKRTLLIAPFDGPLASVLASAALAESWALALGLARGRSPSPAVPGEEGGTVALDYDPRSYVSASSLVLSARNALGEIDAAVLLLDPARAKADFLAAKPGELSGLVEERCSGPLFLARELVRRFEARKSGAILLLAQESPRDAAPGPLAALAEGAFEGLGKGLFAAASGASWKAYGLRDASGQGERAARYAFELLGDPKGAKAGRWLRFTGKSGLFG
jgi:hypothetical protein